MMKKVLVPILLFLIPLMGDAQEAEGLLEELRNAGTDSVVIAVYRKIVHHYGYSDPDSAQFYADKGLAYAERNGYTLGRGIMIHALGQVNERHGLIEVAKAQYLEARTIFVRAGSTRGIAATTNGLGIIAGKTGNYDEATRHFLEALRLFEESGDRNGVVQTYIKLGVVNDHLGNLSEALRYYLKAEELNTGAPSDNASLTLLNNIGIIYGKRNDIPTALRYFRRGLKASDPGKATGVHIALLGSLGIAYERSGKPDSARYFQERALLLARGNRLPEEEARALVNLSSLYRTDDAARSLALLKEALAITERIRQRSLTTEVYEAMIDRYKEANEYEQALLVSEKMQVLKDSLFSLQKSKEIANLHAVHELARQENEINTLAVRNEKSILQRDIMLAVALVAVALIVIVWQFNTKISNLNTELLRKQGELKNSNTIKDKLFSILGHDLRAPLTRVIGLLNVLSLRQQVKDEQEIIEKLRQQSQNTLETLDNLLVWGQRQLKGVRLNQESFRVKDQIMKSIALVGDYAGQKRVELADRTPSDLQVYADPSHFDFVVRNLLSNAVKFSHSGGSVVLNASPHEGVVVFSITDSGVGIAAELQDQIFTSGNESLRGTWDEKGTGIGLMMCREYIAENGGNLWLESEPGKGSTFYFSLQQKPSSAPRAMYRAPVSDGQGFIPSAS